MAPDTRNHVLRAMQREIGLIKHIAAQLTEGGLEYRPSPAQRSTLELLRYLPVCAVHGVHSLVADGGGADPAVAELKRRAARLTLSDFAEAMDVQEAALVRAMGRITDARLAAPADLPWGGTGTMLDVLMVFGPQCLSAYRMQLFLYAKAAGNPALDTTDCWFGATGGD